MYKRKVDEKKRVGGISFYMSIAALAFIALSNAVLLPDLWDAFARGNFMKFLLGAITGGCIAFLFVNEHIAVFVHEFKHAAVSALAGNTLKGIKIGQHTGHYRYTYTEKTAHYNATIALAPYWFPLVSIPLMISAWASGFSFESLVLILGIGYGVDAVSGLRDIHPHQTDLTKLRGGYGIGLLYLTVVHSVLFSLCAAYVFQGVFGLKYLIHGLWNLVVAIVAVWYG